MKDAVENFKWNYTTYFILLQFIIKHIMSNWSKIDIILHVFENK